MFFFTFKKINKMVEYNFPNHRRGTTFKAKRITVSLDLTGARIDLHFKHISSNKIIFSWSTSDGTITFVDAAAGIFLLNKVKLSPPASLYEYDAQLIKADGDVIPLLYGVMRVTQNITQVL